MNKSKRKLVIQVLLCLSTLLIVSCEKDPVFNLFGQKEYPSEELVINPILQFGQIKRVGSVYGTPGAGEGGTDHNGIDIGVDQGVPFIAGCSGVIMNIAEGGDYHSSATDVALRFNEEFSVSYLFEPPKEIVVRVGDLVQEGDIIGYVGSREIGFIDQCVHFWIKRNGQAVCPVPYLREDFRNILNETYRSQGAMNPPNICSCPDHQFYFHK